MGLKIKVPSKSNSMLTESREVNKNDLRSSRNITDQKLGLGLSLLSLLMFTNMIVKQFFKG